MYPTALLFFYACCYYILELFAVSVFLMLKNIILLLFHKWDQNANCFFYCVFIEKDMVL